MTMDPATIPWLILAFAGGGVAAYFFSRRAGGGEKDADLRARLAHIAETQSALESRMSERLQNQERQVTQTLEARLGEVTKRVGEGLEKNTEKTTKTMHDLRERLAVIDAAQKNITELSAQVVGLQDVLSNKQTRGAFGEVQLHDLVTSILPPSAYSFQDTLSNNKRVDCLLRLPNPPGAIAVDAKFPLESYRILRTVDSEEERVVAARAFAADVSKHVKDIAERYIIPGETAESAIMFLPSEAVYAELHANHPGVVDKAFRQKVWIVSPTTLMATLNTVRAVLKDARMRESAGIIQKEVSTLLQDVDRLGDRVNNLSKHFDQAARDIHEIRTSADKIGRRGEKIEEIEVGKDENAEGKAGSELLP